MDTVQLPFPLADKVKTGKVCSLSLSLSLPFILCYYKQRSPGGGPRIHLIEWNLWLLSRWLGIHTASFFRLFLYVITCAWPVSCIWDPLNSYNRKSTQLNVSSSSMPGDRACCGYAVSQWCSGSPFEWRRQKMTESAKDGAADRLGRTTQWFSIISLRLQYKSTVAIAVTSHVQWDASVAVCITSSNQFVTLQQLWKGGGLVRMVRLLLKHMCSRYMKWEACKSSYYGPSASFENSPVAVKSHVALCTLHTGRGNMQCRC